MGLKQGAAYLLWETRFQIKT